MEGKAPNVSPRILLISNLFPPEIGGACAVAESLARELPENIVVVAPKHPPLPPSIPDWKTYDARFPFPVVRVPSFESTFPKVIPGRLRGAAQLIWDLLWVRPRAIRTILSNPLARSVDVVCVNTLGTYWVPSALQRARPRLRSVFYLHGEEVPVAGPPLRYTERLQLRALGEAHGIVAVSTFTRNRLSRIAPAITKTVVINNGVDTSRFTQGPPDVTIQSEFNLHGKQVLLCLARLDRRKGQDRLIQAMPAILAALPATKLLIVGSGEDYERLTRIADGLQLAEAVVFVGGVSDEQLVQFYRTADVFVMPNRQLPSGDTEGFGLVFLEAGACGKPVIGGLAGGVPDAVVDGHTGYLVDGESQTAIAEACIRLLSDRDLAERFGTAGVAHSAANTWAAQSSKFLALCSKLAAEEEHDDGAAKQ